MKEKERKIWFWKGSERSNIIVIIHFFFGIPSFCVVEDSEISLKGVRELVGLDILVCSELGALGGTIGGGD